jgi:hypothetical protein
MKKFIYGFLILGLWSCGGSDEVVSEENEEESDTLMTEVEEENEELAEDVFIPENADGNWQIDDYAEMLTGDKIAASADEANMENSVGWFYQELDLSGGFASVTGAIEGWQEFVVWRMADGDDLVGFMSVGCGPVCDYAFRFYKGQGENAQQIEMNEVFPMTEINELQETKHKEILDRDNGFGFDYPEDAQLYYHFPKKGTSMEVDIVIGADELQEPIFSLSWDKTKFSIAKKY